MHSLKRGVNETGYSTATWTCTFALGTAADEIAQIRPALHGVATRVLNTVCC
jgi:hypothetical protein